MARWLSRRWQPWEWRRPIEAVVVRAWVRMPLSLQLTGAVSALVHLVVQGSDQA